MPLSRHQSQLPNGIEGVTPIVREWNAFNAKNGGLPEAGVGARRARAPAPAVRDRPASTWG